MQEPFQPLRSVTVLAWEQAVSLPMATRLLADLGATIIRVESHQRARPRPRYLANDLARNKLSLALDLRDERGREVFRRLVQATDLVCENFTPRVKRQFGLTYDQLKAVRPDLIMLSLSGYGQTGPWSERPTYGPGIEAASGHAQCIGFPDQPPTRPGTVVFADNISGFYAAFALLGALHYRRATGRGQYIDLSMYEANAYHLGLSIARSSLTGRPEERRGNSDPGAALQDVYPTCEPDRWLAVTVHEHQLDALAELLTVPRSADLGAALREWAGCRTGIAAAEALQATGIAAVPALTSRDLFLNPQLRHRAAFTLVPHDQPVNGYGAHPHGASPWRFTGHPRPPLREAPAPGQDTRVVLSRWLNLPDQEIDALIAANIVGEAAQPAAAHSSRVDASLIARKLAWRLAAAHDPEPERILGLSTV